MERIFGNIDVLGTWIYSKNRDIFVNKFRRDFNVYRNYDLLKKDKKRIFSKMESIEDEKIDDILD